MPCEDEGCGRWEFRMSALVFACNRHGSGVLTGLDSTGGWWRTCSMPLVCLVEEMTSRGDDEQRRAVCVGVHDGREGGDDM